MTSVLRRAGTIGSATVLGVLTVAPAEADATRSTVEVRRWADVRSGQWLDELGRGRLTLVGRWDAVPGRPGPSHPGRAVRFADHSMAIASDRRSLDPGRRRFAAAVVFRVPRGVDAFVGADSPNIVQKGHYASRGQWKLQLAGGDGGRVQCRIKGRVKGSAASVMLTSPVGHMTDGRWHTAACARGPHRVVLVVDGTVTSQRVRVGRISSSAPLTVGNRGLRSTSDQFRGVVDSVVICRGRQALRRALAAAR